MQILNFNISVMNYLAMSLSTFLYSSKQLLYNHKIVKVSHMNRESMNDPLPETSGIILAATTIHLHEIDCHKYFGNALHDTAKQNAESPSSY